jgi:hypothetical protein
MGEITQQWRFKHKTIELFPDVCYDVWQSAKHGAIRAI